MFVVFSKAVDILIVRVHFAANRSKLSKSASDLVSHFSFV